MTPIKTLPANSMNHMAEYVRKQFHVEVGPDVTIEDVMKPGFWTHHVRKLSKNDIVEVLGSGFELRLRVLETGIAYAKMRLLSMWKDDAVVKADAKASEIEAPEGYVVDHTPHTRWRARMTDGTLIIRDQKTKQEAVEAARQHAVKLGVIAA